jgi:hypothetical protein
MAAQRVLFFAAILVATTILGGCGGSPDAARGGSSAPPSRTADPSGPANDPALMAAADSAESFLSTSYRTAYAGLAIDYGRRLITIYRKADPSLDADLRNRIHVHFVFRDAKYSLTEMQSLVNRVMVDRPYWKGKGIDIQVVGPMVNGAGVQVDTPQGTLAQQKALEQRYGPGAIRIGKAAISPA